MPRDLKPIPRNIVQVEQAQITPYLASQGKPDSDEGTVFSRNRGKDLSFKGNKIKDISIGLEDIDGAIQYYFDNIIKPNVIQNGNRVAVPVIFGDAEKWKSVQNDGFYRDKDGKIMAPLIMYKRTGVEKNRTLGSKVDGNQAHLFNVFETRYNAKNFYDKFDILTNRKPSKQYYVSVVPDYVTVTYECVLFTNFVEQNNSLIEAIEYASDSYWGDFKRWHFRTRIDTFAVTNVVEQGDDRAARTTFTMTLNGYLIPDTVNKQLANEDLLYSPAQVVFGLETTNDLVTITPATQMSANNTAGSTSFIGDGNIIQNITIEGAALADLIYLNTNIVKKANVITVPNQALFTGAIILQPAGASELPATTINNFVFYINGQYVPSAFASFVSDAFGVRVQFNTISIGYTLETDDEVIAIGKFVS
jgi:hypothetical protein